MTTSNKIQTARQGRKVVMTITTKTTTTTTPAIGSLVEIPHLRIGGRVLADAHMHRPARAGYVWVRECGLAVKWPFVGEIAIQKLRVVESA